MAGFDPPSGRRPIFRSEALACREEWPECRVFGYDPHCCRFPKSCSAPPLPPCDDPTVPARALEAAQWLSMRMHDPEIQLAVAGALRRSSSETIAEWARALPGEVLAFREALEEVAAQDADFEAKVLQSGEDHLAR